jgi:hypothetical protein
VTLAELCIELTYLHDDEAEAFFRARRVAHGCRMTGPPTWLCGRVRRVGSRVGVTARGSA